MIPFLYWALLIAICGYAFWRGRSDERVVAAVCLVASVVTPFAVAPLQSRFSSVEFGVLAVDIVVLAFFVAVALRSARFWPLWISGLQLTTTMAHLMKAIELDLVRYAYGAAASFWSYPILLILAVGTWRSHQRAKLEPVPT